MVGVFKMQIVLNFELQSIYVQSKMETRPAQWEKESKTAKHTLFANAAHVRRREISACKEKKSAACFRSTPSAAGVSFLEIDLY